MPRTLKDKRVSGYSMGTTGKAIKKLIRKGTSKNKRLKGTVTGKWKNRKDTTVRRTKRKSPTPKKR